MLFPPNIPSYYETLQQSSLKEIILKKQQHGPVPAQTPIKKKQVTQTHSRFRLLQSSFHRLDLLEMTGHIRGHHHLNYQGPKFPFRDTPWRKKGESQNGK